MARRHYDPYEDPQFRRWARRVSDELEPMINSSSFVMSLVPDVGKVDVKFAVELGLSIMLDKPIVVVVTPGVRVPDKLVQIADMIFEGEVRTQEGKESLSARLNEYVAERFPPDPNQPGVG